MRIDPVGGFSSVEMSQGDAAREDAVVTAIPGAAVDEQVIAAQGEESSTGSDVGNEVAGGAGLLMPAMPVAVEAAQAILTAAQMPALIPEVAGILSEVIALDVTGVERGLAEILNKIESLAANALGETETHQAGVRLAAMAGLFVGLHLLLIDSKARRPMNWCLMRATRAQGRPPRGHAHRRSWHSFW